jgi:hypothetical protein
MRSLRCSAIELDVTVSASLRIADFQSAPGSGLRKMRKNRIQNPRTLTAIAQRRPNFGAATCSKPSSEPCAEQNHLREKIEKIAKTKNRVLLSSAPHCIASL